MRKFCYVSEYMRSAWKIYFKNEELLWDTSWIDDKFIERFHKKIEKERMHCGRYARPATWFLNDIEEVDTYLFPMSQKHFNGAHEIKYEWTDGLGSLKDILLQRASDIAARGKLIEIFYSGGIDSTATLLAFNEVCKPDQMKIWMAGEQVIPNNQKLFDKVIKHLNYEHTLDLVGCADPSKNIFTTGNEADRLFGADGYTLLMANAKRGGRGYVVGGKDEVPTTDAPENWQWNQDRWWGITKHTYLTQSWRLLINIKCEKMDLDNYQPLFFDKKVLQFAINLHIEGKHKWYNSGRLADADRYREGKIWIRDFIYDLSGDKEYAYGSGKTLSYPEDLSASLKLPLHPEFCVLAIMDDGTVVTRDNLLDFMKKEYILL
jgi:hypothetical protein